MNYKTWTQKLKWKRVRNLKFDSLCVSAFKIKKQQKRIEYARLHLPSFNHFSIKKRETKESIRKYYFEFCRQLKMILIMKLKRPTSTPLQWNKKTKLKSSTKQSFWKCTEARLVFVEKKRRRSRRSSGNKTKGLQLWQDWKQGRLAAASLFIFFFHSTAATRQSNPCECRAN